MAVVREKDSGGMYHSGSSGDRRKAEGFRYILEVELYPGFDSRNKSDIAIVT